MLTLLDFTAQAAPAAARVRSNPEPSYDTPLTLSEAAQFEAWRATLPPQLQSDVDYDLRGAWKANAQEAANGHLPDTFKKPNHPTFSDESRYSDADHPGGQWAQDGKGKWQFKATPFNVRQNPNLPDYFKRVEPDSTLVLPPPG